jgi:hypothetical protein
VAELRGGGLSEDHRAVLANTRHRRSVVEPRLIGVHGARALKRRHAPGQHDVLDRHRHSIEEASRLSARPSRLAGAGGFEGAVGVDPAEGVERLVHLLDPRESGAGRLDRRQRAGAVGMEQLGGGPEVEGLGHGGLHESERVQRAA